MKREWLILFIIFFITLGTRLHFAYSTEYFSPEAYFNLGQVEYIRAHGRPLFQDNLSYGGRYFIFPPLFHYILAFFNLFFSLDFVAKVIPNIFASSLIFAVYLIAKEITKNSQTALFSAFISGFIPVFFAGTANNISEYSLLIPLMFYTLYCFLKIKENKRYARYFIILLFILPLLHQTAFLFILGLFVYLVLAKTERLKIGQEEIEAIIFSVFIVFWIQFLIYKKAFLVHGPLIIWQNIPTPILSHYYTNLNIPEAVYEIGIIPFIFGIFVIYHYIFREKTRETYLLFGFALATGFLLWLRLIQLNVGLMFLGIILTILFAQFYKAFFIFLEKTKVANYKNIFIVIFILLFLLTSIFPSVAYSKQEMLKAPAKKEIIALSWLRDNTEEEAVVFSSLKDSFLIANIAKKKTVIDTNFLLVHNINQRFEDYYTLFTTPYEIDAVRILNKYDADYIYFSENAKKEFNISDLAYLTERKCFERVYNEVKIYRVICRIEEE